MQNGNGALSPSTAAERLERGFCVEAVEFADSNVMVGADREAKCEMEGRSRSSEDVEEPGADKPGRQL